MYTLTRGRLEEDMPNVNRFPSRYSVEPETRNRRICDHGCRERAEDEVERDRIQENPEGVRKWPDGTTTVDGGAAFKAVKAEYDP